MYHEKDIYSNFFRIQYGMGSAKSNKNWYRTRSDIAFFLSRYKKLLIILGLLVLFGIVVGIITASKVSGSITIKNLLDKNLYNFLAGKKSNFGLFFSYLFSFLVLASLIIFLNFSPWLMIFTFISLIFYSYFIAFNVTCIIVLYPLGGIINTILIIIPCGCMLTFILLLMAAIAIKRGILFKRYGGEYTNRCQTINYVKVYIILLLLSIIVLFIMCLLLPLAKVTIIVT